MPGTERSARVPRVHRPSDRGATAQARGVTFAQQTRKVGTGVTLASPLTGDLFTGALAQYASRVVPYDTQARGWIYRALKEPGIVAKMSGNTGTLPELVVCGRYLDRGFKLHINLLFQEEKLRFFRHFGRTFISDVAIVAGGGGIILLPIDGVRFHNRTLKQQLDVVARDQALSRIGKVVPIPDVECYSAVRLNNFLLRHQVP